jgi:uncharacterized membrane protein YadS
MALHGTLVRVLLLVPMVMALLLLCSNENESE